MWSRIEATLRSDIRAGRLKPGERMESEHGLAERFGVNRHTVRQALRSLAEKGLVRAMRGSGTFVAETAVDYVLARRTRFTENMTASGLDSRRVLLESGTIRADATVAARLHVRRGTLLLRLITLSEARGRPISIAVHLLPASRFAGIAAAFSRTGSLTRAYAEFGVQDFTRRTSWVTARIAPPEVAQRLLQAPAHPVLHVESVNVDAHGVPIEVCSTDFAGERVQIVFEPERGDE